MSARSSSGPLLLQAHTYLAWHLKHSLTFITFPFPHLSLPYFFIYLIFLPTAVVSAECCAAYHRMLLLLLLLLACNTHSSPCPSHIIAICSAFKFISFDVKSKSNDVCCLSSKPAKPSASYKCVFPHFIFYSF